MIHSRPSPILVLALSSAITSLDFTIIFLALPSIQADLGATVADTQWVAAVYAVAYGGFLLLGGRLADTYGRRRCFVAGLLGFGVTSAVGPTWIVSTIAVTAVVALRAVSRRSGAALVPRRVATDRNLRTAALVGTAFMGAFGTVYFLLSLDLQAVRGISPTLTGVAMIPGSLGGVVGSFLAGRAMQTHPPRTVVSRSMILGGVGLGLIAATVALPLPFLLACLGFASIVQGVAYAATFALAGHTVASEDQGMATGVVSTGQQIGSAIGLAVATLCVESAGPSDMRSGIALALGIAAIVVVVSGVRTTSWVASTRGYRRAEQG